MQSNPKYDFCISHLIALASLGSFSHELHLCKLSTLGAGQSQVTCHDQWFNRCFTRQSLPFDPFDAFWEVLVYTIAALSHRQIRQTTVLVPGFHLLRSSLVVAKGRRDQALVSLDWRLIQAHSIQSFAHHMDLLLLHTTFQCIGLVSLTVEADAWTCLLQI